MEVLDMITPQRQAKVHERSFEQLYERAFPRVAHFVSNMNGTFDDAKDIFHDALVIFFEKTSSDKDFLTLSDEAYLSGIAKHLWIRKFKHDRHRISLDETEVAISLPDDSHEHPDAGRLLQFLEKAGKRCMDLLRAVYYQKLPVKDVSKKLGYQNEHSTSVQKYKCLEKIRDTIKEKAMNYEDFLE